MAHKLWGQDSHIITCRALEGVAFGFCFDGFCMIDFKFLEPDGWMELLRLSADLSKEKASL